MKFKFILCLTFALGGGLLGCSSTVQKKPCNPDAIGLFVATLSADHGLWQNGVDRIQTTQAVSPEDVVSETFQTAQFERGRVTTYQVLRIQKVHINDFPETYTAVLVDTNFGRMIVLMRFVGDKNSMPGHWWRRVYDANPQIRRLY